MTNQITINKLHEMRLTAMADAFEQQLDDPSLNSVPFEDRLAMLVDYEYSVRRSNKLKRLIRSASFDQPTASIADIDYRSGRKLEKVTIERLASCEYISEGRNIFITGATGSGKTYLACALGMEACKQFYKTKYIRLMDYLIEAKVARESDTYLKLLDAYSKPALLIIDEWLLLKPTEEEQRDILELIHRRSARSSTIFCSQYLPEGWYNQLGGDASPIADAILDRILYNTYKIHITGVDEGNSGSMRELYGLGHAR